MRSKINLRSLFLLIGPYSHITEVYRSAQHVDTPHALVTGEIKDEEENETQSGNCCNTSNLIFSFLLFFG